MVRKYLVAERAERGMTQADLATAVGATRNTIIKLESGLSIDEGIEGRIERFLGWDLGSLDAIRSGGRPILTTAGDAGDLYQRERRDEVEEAMWSVKGASRDDRWDAIFERRTRLDRERRLRQDQDREKQLRRDSPLDQTGG